MQKPWIEMLKGYDYLIVDGYNVGFQWVEAGFLLPGELDYLRLQLINLLGSLASYWDVYCLLVFDAHLVKKGLGQSEQMGQLTVIFTVEQETADKAIERLSADLVTMGQRVLVCTSDKTEQDTVFVQGAGRMSARELLVEVKKTQKEMANSFGQQRAARQRSWLGDSLPKEVREALDVLLHGPRGGSS